jgi:hypothetical protein
VYVFLECACNRAFCWKLTCYVRCIHFIRILQTTSDDDWTCCMKRTHKWKENTEDFKPIGRKVRWATRGLSSWDATANLQICKNHRHGSRSGGACLRVTPLAAPADLETRGSSNEGPEATWAILLGPVGPRGDGASILPYPITPKLWEARSRLYRRRLLLRNTRWN